MKQKHRVKQLCVFLTLFFTIALYTNTYTQPKADLVVFSFNRPLQLYAFLESVDFYVQGLEEIHVIYRASDTQYALAYQKVVQSFPTVLFHVQSASPHQDFKPLTLKATFQSPADYILFAVDDIIIKDFIEISADIEALEEHNAYGLYYRLGLHLTWSYTRNRSQKQPPLQPLKNGLYLWQFSSGQYDWNYPNTLDMTLYRKKDIQEALTQIDYKAPNSLEGKWNSHGIHNTINKQYGLCYEESKMVNLPLNIVQDECNNRHSNKLSAKKLLEIFNSGLKINIATLYRISNKSAHIDYNPEFIRR